MPPQTLSFQFSPLSFSSSVDLCDSSCSRFAILPAPAQCLLSTFLILVGFVNGSCCLWFNSSSTWFNIKSTMLARIHNNKICFHVKLRPNAQSLWLAVQHTWNRQERSQRRSIFPAPSQIPDPRPETRAQCSHGGSLVRIRNEGQITNLRHVWRNHFNTNPCV